jgi:hypothetical protein
LWLSIFSYFEAHDLFHAFNNLNTYFNQILASSHLSFYLNLKKDDNNHVKRPTNPYWSDSILNRVIYLQSTNYNQSDYFIEFLRWNYKKLVQLQSLIFQMDIVHVPVICQVLPEIYLLEYLSITCAMTPTLFRCILAIPTLRLCRLKVTSTTYNHDVYSEKNSNLEILHVTLLRVVSYCWMKLLLPYMPKLKRLEISATASSIHRPLRLWPKPFIILPELRILKYKFDYRYTIPSFINDLYREVCDLRGLDVSMPNLKYFDLNICNTNMNQYLSDKKANQWWIDLKKLEQVKIIIHGYYDNSLYDDRRFDDYQKAVFSKNDELNNCFKFQWLKKNSKNSLGVELTIKITK